MKEAIEDFILTDDRELIVTQVSERCAKAEAEFSGGEIDLGQMYNVYTNEIIPGAYDCYGPWAKLVSRACRIARLVGEDVKWHLY